MILSVENISHSYGERVALRALSFTVERGAAHGLLGPNGCGKSTLFRILTTLLKPSSGDAVIDGARLSGRSSAVRRKLGVVFQAGSLDARLTVEENLVTQGHMYGLSGLSLRGRIRTLLELFRLSDRAGSMAGTLSGGQRRRVEISKAMLHEPPVLLMDEATSGLDPASRRELWQTLHELRAMRGVTVLFTTHLMDEAENATRLLLMNQGATIGEGTPEEFKSRVGGDVVVFQPAQPGLAAALRERFAVEPVHVGEEIHVETPAGHRFIAEAMEALPGRIAAASLHKPTLEDVFLKLTGAPLEATPHA